MRAAPGQVFPLSAVGTLDGCGEERERESLPNPHRAPERSFAAPTPYCRPTTEAPICAPASGGQDDVRGGRYVSARTGTLAYPERARSDVTAVGYGTLVVVGVGLGERDQRAAMGTGICWATPGAACSSSRSAGFRRCGAGTLSA